MNWKTETIISSPIPVSAEQLPQQRVTKLLRCRTDQKISNPIESFIDYYPDYPVSTPRKTLFLGGVEWAWSPMRQNG